jgi:hypothetical protein
MVLALWREGRLILAIVIVVVEVVEERAGARNRLVLETAMVHGVVVLVPPPITLWQLLAGGWLLLCTRLGANKI